MEQKKILKLQKPSGLRPPQIRVNKPLSEGENKKLPTIAESKICRRRSKSITDLQNVAEQSEVTTKQLLF